MCGQLIALSGERELERERDTSGQKAEETGDFPPAPGAVERESD